MFQNRLLSTFKVCGRMYQERQVILNGPFKKKLYILIFYMFFLLLQSIKTFQPFLNTVIRI